LVDLIKIEVVRMSRIGKKRISSLTILLPTRDEVVSIGAVIDEIEKNIDCDILVMDGLSTDGTVEVARGRGVRVLFEYRKSKGIAVRSALKFIETPYVIMMNADYTYPAEYLAIIYHILSHSNSDVVIGYRNIKEKDSMSFLNSFGNFFLSTLAGILYSHRVYDLCTGMWGFKKEILDKFNLTGKDFSLEADLFINSVRSGCEISQVPIAYRKRLGESKSKLKVLDGFRIAWFLIRRRFAW